MQEWDPKEKTDYSVIRTSGLKGMIEKNDCLTSAMQMICTFLIQNLSRPNQQDLGCGNPITNARRAKLSTF